MKSFFASLLILTTGLLSAQKQDCSWKPGSTVVCDSVRNLCRVDAHYLTLVAVSKPTSHWYDSILLPQELEFNYCNALCAMYNDLPDSLADFRWYIKALSIYAQPFHPDSTKIISVAVPIDALDQITAKGPFPWSGNFAVDSIMRKAGLEYVGRGTGGVFHSTSLYKCPPNINICRVDRQLKNVHPHIEMSPVPVYLKWHYLMDIDEGPDQYSVSVLEQSKCMPPELPCHFIKRTFYYREEWGLRYVKFERGVIPWPVPKD